MKTPTLEPPSRPETVPVDPDFPQLKTACDPAQMIEVFRRHLKPVSGRPCLIQACIPFRFRFRQAGTRCVLQYTLQVVEPGTGRQWDLWATALLYADAGEAERLWQEVQTADAGWEIPERWLTFEPVNFIPELQMLVQIFPYDRKLRNLCAVLDGALPGIEPLMLARLGPGKWQAEARTVEPTRYRTELGAALKYTLQAREAATARSETLRCYAKVYRNKRGEETFELLQSLSKRAEEGKNSYAAVRPLAYLAELRTLVLEEAAGTSLQQILLEGGDTSGAMRKVARAVAAFNQDDLVIAQHHSLADQVEDVKRASRLVQWACPEMRAEARALTEAVVTGLAAVPPAPIHRDLKTDHIFLSNGHVIFIDLDSVARGDPVRDPAHLFAHLTARVGMDSLPREQALTAAAAFVEEYFAHVPAPWRERFALHCAGALIEVAGGIFKRQEHRWLDKVAAAIQDAQHALSGGFQTT